MFARLASATAVVAVVVVLSGCVAEPAPSPTPTAPFSSEEEAFAAAEETYRAYVDALNDVDLSDPETFEAVYAWTTGEANADERTNLSAMHGDKWTVSGQTKVINFVGREFLPAAVEIVSAVLCSDVSEIDVRDENGKSMVGLDRPDQYALSVDFTAAPTTSGLQISASKRIEDDACSP